MQIYSEEQVRTKIGIVFLLDCEEKMKNSMKKEILYVLSFDTTWSFFSFSDSCDDLSIKVSGGVLWFFSFRDDFISVDWIMRGNFQRLQVIAKIYEVVYV